MHLKPPHLETEEDLVPREISDKKFSKIGPQGPSKYGKGGSRAFKALGRKKKK